MDENRKNITSVGFTGEFYFFEESFDSKGFPDAFYVDITPVAAEKERLIRILADDREIIFQLNDSPAARSLYDQLPLILPVENYGGNEKIFYPPRELDVSDTPLAQGPAGTLAYYAPWGDVAIFYGQCSGASGLYALGEAVSGADQIAALDGEIRMERVTDSGVIPTAASAAASAAGPRRPAASGRRGRLRPGRDGAVQRHRPDVPHPPPARARRAARRPGRNGRTLPARTGQRPARDSQPDSGARRPGAVSACLRA